MGVVPTDIKYDEIATVNVHWKMSTVGLDGIIMSLGITSFYGCDEVFIAPSEADKLSCNL